MFRDVYFNGKGKRRGFRKGVMGWCEEETKSEQGGCLFTMGGRGGNSLPAMTNLGRVSMLGKQTDARDLFPASEKGKVLRTVKKE